MVLNFVVGFCKGQMKLYLKHTQTRDMQESITFQTK